MVTSETTNPLSPQKISSYSIASLMGILFCRGKFRVFANGVTIVKIYTS